MEYTKTVWKDLPDTSTPITADRLNNIENGVEYLFEHGVDSYSTSEVKTNKTWINGKPIYRKVFLITVGNNSDIHIEHNLTSSNNFWINYGESFIKKTSGDYETLPCNWYYTPDDWARTWMIQDYIRFRSPSSLGERTLYAVVEYTKTTD